jgi:hypothetical protein
MSGFEVVGLVLGLAPLVTKAAEKARPAARILFWKQRELDQYIAALTAFDTNLRCLLETVIGNTSLDYRTQRDLVEIPFNSESWQRSDVQIHLRKSLGERASRDLLDMLTQMTHIFEGLMIKSGVPESQTTPHVCSHSSWTARH